MGFKRKQSRIDVGRNGRIQRGSLSAPCKVLDVSESGVRIESRMFVKVGDTLHLVIELDRGHTLSCTIQPIHVRTPRFGALITAISPENQERLSQILDDRVQRMFSSR
jgi:PilZ domain